MKTKNILLFLTLLMVNMLYSCGDDKTSINEPENEKVSWTRQTSGTTATLNDVCFTDTNNGFIVGFSYNRTHYENTILRTTDGGMTWKSKITPSNIKYYSVNFINAANGFMVGRDYTDPNYTNPGATCILKTTDGGEYWQQLMSFNRLKTSRCIYFADIDHGWAVGDDGEIISTSDGGLTWKSNNIGSLTWFEVYFNDINHGWIVGQSGYIMRTTDGGRVWSTTIVSTNNLYSVSFVDTSVGWAAGANGTIIKTTDGGLTWIEQLSEKDCFFKRIRFVDINNGYTVGCHGIIKTTDGGTTWTRESTTSGGLLYGLSFIDLNNAWAVGEGGTIYTKTK